MYYENTFSGNFTPGYLQKQDTADTLFNADFETATLTQWTSNVNDAGDLSASDSADYWGLYGMKAVINDNNSIYVQDDSPNNETQYRARFYVNPNSLTMAGGDILDLFTGRNSTTDVLRIQLQKNGATYQVRAGLLNDAGTWTDTSWYNINNSWNAVEIQYQAFANSGSLTLWLDDVQKQSITFIDNDTRTLTEVRLGAQGVDTNTSGTLYFDDFESRRFSYIGTLTDPGVDDPTATNQAGWFTRTYAYSATIPHAVSSVTSEQSAVDSYEYDANGNMTCRVEGGITFKQDYNAENRISAIHKMNGNCSTGTVTESWLYGYDGDGVRVSTAHYTGVTQDSLTLYYMGGAYEVTGSAVKKYYSMAGQTIMRDSDGSLKYLLTDHLGSTSAVVDGNGTLLSQQRYLPFGEVRTIPNSPVTQTDFGYTFQRNLSGTGLMDYKARFYSSGLGRFVQPDSIIPNPANPQAFNRFSYVYNRPINFNDPSGHDPWWCEGNDYCMYMWIEDHTTAGGDAYFEEYGITTSGLTKKDKREVFKGVTTVANELLRIYNDNCTNCDARTSQDVFKDVFGPISITKTTEDNAYCTSGFPISCGSGTRITARLIVHELGHLFNSQANNNPYSDMGSASIFDAFGNWVTGQHFDTEEGLYEWDRSMAGYASGCAPYTYHGRCEVNGQLVWDDWNTVHEEYADMFLNWSFNSFVGVPGDARYDWMEQRMWGWLSVALTP